MDVALNALSLQIKEIMNCLKILLLSFLDKKFVIQEYPLF